MVCLITDEVSICITRKKFNVSLHKSNYVCADSSDITYQFLSVGLGFRTMATTQMGNGGDKRWSLEGTTALVTGGTRGIGYGHRFLFHNR